MEKAVMKITKTKSGDYVGTVAFPDGKSMSVPKGFSLNESYNNLDCEILREAGLIKKIAVNGKELTSNQGQKPMQKSNQFQHGKDQKRYNRAANNIRGANNNQNNRFANHDRAGQVQRSRYDGAAQGAQQNSEERATAPYNFIKLHKKVVEGPLDPAEGMGIFCKYSSNLITGYIDVEIGTLTPCYIRGTRENAEEDSSRKPEFFSPNGSLLMPGSSLRGMIRNLVEIVSWSKFKFFDDRTYYYRSMADQAHSIRDEYRRILGTESGDSDNCHSGYLTKDGLQYYIIPALIGSNGMQYDKVLRENRVVFSYDFLPDGRCHVYSGDMNNKRHDWIINPPDHEQNRIALIHDDIEAYEDDATRFYDKKEKNEAMRRDGDLLRQLKFSKEGMVPCFYAFWTEKSNGTTNGRQRVAFGHTRYFRLPYYHSVKDHIPSYLREGDKPDFSEAIFGMEGKFASRVFFEDAEMVPGQEEPLLKVSSPLILSSPKPTTFQHYLRQDGMVIRRLNHWNNSTANIRGHKLYWHRRPKDEGPKTWREETIKNTPSHTIIQPVRARLKFQGRIRFENLCREELGALLFALNLPTGCHHKLGMGKPLGLGSVSIQTKLWISGKGRRERYSTLFDEDRWLTGETEAEPQPYMKAFEEYMKGRLGEEWGNAGSLWETERLEKLKMMLDYERSGNDEDDWWKETSYMTLEKFKLRRVLPEPETVYGD